MLGHTVVAHNELGLGVDGVAAVGEAELEELALGDGLGGTGLDTQVAVDATQVVDLVDEPEALTGRSGLLGIVVGAAHIDALRGTDPCAQLAADALLHPVVVTVEHMTTVESLGLGDLFVATLGALAPLGHPSARVGGGGQPAAEEAVLLDRDQESV